MTQMTQIKEDSVFAFIGCPAPGEELLPYDGAVFYVGMDGHVYRARPHEAPEKITERLVVEMEENEIQEAPQQ